MIFDIRQHASCRSWTIKTIRPIDTSALQLQALQTLANRGCKGITYAFSYWSMQCPRNSVRQLNACMLDPTTSPRLRTDYYDRFPGIDISWFFHAI